MSFENFNTNVINSTGSGSTKKKKEEEKTTATSGGFSNFSKAMNLETPKAPEPKKEEQVLEAPVIEKPKETTLEKVYKITENPILKTVSKIVPSLMTVLGKTVGAATGAASVVVNTPIFSAGQGIIDTKNIIQGKGYNPKKSLKNIASNVKEAYKFGEGAGFQGAQVAPIGAAAVAAPAVFAYSFDAMMTATAGKNIYESITEYGDEKSKAILSGMSDKDADAAGIAAGIESLGKTGWETLGASPEEASAFIKNPSLIGAGVFLNALGAYAGARGASKSLFNDIAKNGKGVLKEDRIELSKDQFNEYLKTKGGELPPEMPDGTFTVSKVDTTVKGKLLTPVGSSVKPKIALQFKPADGAVKPIEIEGAPTSKSISKLNSLKENLSKSENINNTELISTVSKEKSIFENYANSKKESVLTIQGKNAAESVASIDVLKLEDGKYVYKVDGNTPNYSVMDTFDQGGTFKTREEAVSAGKEHLKEWANNTLSDSSADINDHAVLNKIIQGLDSFNPKFSDIPVVMVEKVTPEKAISTETSKQEEKFYPLFSRLFELQDKVDPEGVMITGERQEKAAELLKSEANLSDEDVNFLIDEIQYMGPGVVESPERFKQYIEEKNIFNNEKPIKVEKTKQKKSTVKKYASFPGVAEGQYENFRKLVKNIDSETLETSDYAGITNILKGKGKDITELDNSLYSGEKSGDDVLDMFKKKLLSDRGVTSEKMEITDKNFSKEYAKYLKDEKEIEELERSPEIDIAKIDLKTGEIEKEIKTLENEIIINDNKQYEERQRADNSEEKPSKEIEKSEGEGEKIKLINDFENAPTLKNLKELMSKFDDYGSFFELFSNNISDNSLATDLIPESGEVNLRAIFETVKPIKKLSLPTNEDEMVAYLKQNYPMGISLFHQTSQAAKNSILKNGFEGDEAGDVYFTVRRYDKNRATAGGNEAVIGINLLSKDYGQILPDPGAGYQGSDSERIAAMFEDGFDGNDITIPADVANKYLEDLVDGSGLPISSSEKIDTLKQEKKPLTSRQLAEQKIKIDLPENFPIKISPDDIPYETALRASEGSSFYGEERAIRHQKDYIESMKSFYEKYKDKVNTPAKKAILIDYLQRYKDGYIKRELSILSTRAGITSVMIAGPANFPVARNQKRLNSEMNKIEEMAEWEKKIESGLEKSLKNSEVEEAGGELAMAEKNLSELIKIQETMKTVNKIVRKKITDEEKKAEIMAAGISEKIADAALEVYMGKQGFQSFSLTSTNNKIKTLQAKIESLKKRETMTSEDSKVIGTYQGAKVVVNYKIDRTQIFFDEIPGQELRSELKSHGWRWSPIEKAWQRKMTGDAYSAKKIMENNFKAKDSSIEKEKQAYSGSGENASIGTFEDGTPVELGSLKNINPIEMPEMVRLARELTGAAPKVKAKMGNKLGYMRGKDDGEIVLRADLFARGNEEQVAKTLAHEIGHLADWLPDKNLKRGNLLGRIYSLNRFMKSTFGGTDEGLFGKQSINLKNLRDTAFKSILKKSNYTYGEYITTKAIREELKPKIKSLYQQLLESTGAIKNEDVRKELTALSEYWRPYDKENSDAKFIKYRNSPKELYADAISVLFNSPGTLEKMAPIFYKEFFAALDAKPEFKAEYFELQELLNGSTEEIFKARKEDIRAGFSKAEAIQADFAEKKKAGKKAYWERLRQQLDDINYPITKKQRIAELNGAEFKEEDNPKFILQEESYIDNENFLLVDDIDKNVVKPIEEAGMIIDDLGEYLLLHRIQNDRADIANPFGFNVKNASEQLNFLKENVGEKNFALLQEKAQYFHDLVFKSVEEAVAVGSYNKEVFETRIKPNKDSYASFQVVDYMQDYMPATIKGQVGTLKEVANPFVSTILKTVALNRLNAHQRAKNATVKLLKENFPEDIKESKRITSDGKLTIFKPAKDRGALQLLEDGKLVSYDVDPYIAESFNFNKVGDMNVLVSLLDKFNNKLFKPLVTTYNLGFAAAFNPIRDFRRNYKLIPNATVFNLLDAYVKSLPSAIKYSKGQMDEFTRSLVESKAINAPINDYNYDPREDELGRILERYGLIKKDEIPTNKAVRALRMTLLKPVATILESIRFVANTFEIVSKVAGAKVRIAGGEKGKELAYNLRNFTGTPNYKVKGLQTNTTNAIFVFSNIAKEGLKSDFKIATNPKTRSGYWWKTVKIDILPKLLMFLAGAGVLGSVLKEFFDDVSEYDKANYIIIPLGWYESDKGSFGMIGRGEANNGRKAVYMRIPHDEVGRLIASSFWKMANMIKDGGDAKALQDIFSIGAGQLPSVTPALTVAAAWEQYLSGKNPYDNFRGRTVIDDTTFAAGGAASLKKMVQWTTNNIGLTKFATFDKSKQTGLESTIQVAPWFSSLFKISNYGQQEKLKEIGAEAKQVDARRVLEERKIIEKYVKQARENKSTLFAASKYKTSIIKETLGGHMPKNKTEENIADNMMTKFKRALKKGLNEDPRIDTILSATSNNQKKEIIKEIVKGMSDSEFREFKKGLIVDKIVTSEVMFGITNK